MSGAGSVEGLIGSRAARKIADGIEWSVVSNIVILGAGHAEFTSLALANRRPGIPVVLVEGGDRAAAQLATRHGHLDAVAIEHVDPEEAARTIGTSSPGTVSLLVSFAPLVTMGPERARDYLSAIGTCLRVDGTAIIVQHTPLMAPLLGSCLHVQGSTEIAALPPVIVYVCGKRSQHIALEVRYPQGGS